MTWRKVVAAPFAAVFLVLISPAIAAICVAAFIDWCLSSFGPPLPEGDDDWSLR